MRTMGMRRPRRKGKFLFSVLLILVIIALILVDAQIRPIIKSVSATKAKNICTQIINNTVVETLADQQITYDDLVSIAEDGEGKITAVKMQSSKINLLMAQLTQAITVKMANIDRQTVSIPLGTLLGGDLFNGRGSKIKIKLMLEGNVTTDVESRFLSGGINQTHHQIMMQVETSIYTIIPGYNSTTNVHTDICIAETILVGIVPEAFTNVDTTSSSDDMGGILSDYGASVE